MTNKPVAKTPDVRGALELILSRYYGDADYTMYEAISDIQPLIEAAKTERDELQQVFDMRWDADMRAIKMWQEGHPERKLTWPDHADLCCFLLEKLEAAKAERDEYWKDKITTYITSDVRKVDK